MTDTSELIGALLDSCCEQVLETMCFSSVLDHPEHPMRFDRDHVVATMAFTGKPSGIFEAEADFEALRIMTAGFMGIDEAEATEQQMNDLLTEFSNMTCGLALSSLARVEYFHLATPVAERRFEQMDETGGVRRCYELLGGMLAVSLRVDFD